MNLTFYHYWRSSSSWRVRWALEYKGIAYKAAHVSLLDGESESAAHMARHPMGWVPVLDIGGEKYVESLAIIEWLEEVNPSPTLYHGDPLERLHIRSLAETINAGVQPVTNLTTLDQYSDDPIKRKAWTQYFIRRGFNTFEKLISESAGKFSHGEQLTVADLCLIPQCYNALRNEMNLDEWPRIASIYKNALETPSCQKSHPEKWKPSGV